MPAPTPSVKAVFDRALDLAAPARAAYLDAACAGAPDVRVKVEALLRAYASAGSFLESPAHTAAAPTGEHVPDGSTRTFGETAAAAAVAGELAPGVVVAGRYTLADIGLYAYTHVAAEGGFPLDRYPAIRAWCARIAARPGHRPITAR